MIEAKPIRIAAAMIDNGEGQMLLVRKAGTTWFMQAGGKVEPEESPVAALCRELREEIGLSVDLAAPRYVGRFQAPAANESGRTVDAELYHLRSDVPVIPTAEIEEAVWVDYETADVMPLAPLTRAVVLPLFRSLEMAV